MLGISCLHAKIFLKTERPQKLQNAVLMAMAMAMLWFLVLPMVSIFKPELGRTSMMIAGQIHAIIMFVISVLAYRNHKGVGGTVPGLLFLIVWTVYLVSGLSYFAYHWLQFPIYIMLFIHFTQGAIVAALLGCAVSALLVYRHQQAKREVLFQKNHNQLYEAAHHDLWQPIQSIGLYTAALDTATEAEKKKYQLSISSAVTSVHDFMEGLRRIDFVPILQTIDLHTLLASLVDEYRLIASHKQISLRYHQTPIQIQAEPVLMQRVVRNLLSNAIRYTNAGGGILLGVRRQRGLHWLMVYDTGIGMTPEQAAQSFEVFVRLGDQGRVPEGLGLGLYSVKHMADQMGLQTWLASQLNKGTAIGISLGLVANTRFKG